VKGQYLLFSAGLFFITFSSLSRRSVENRVSLFGIADCSFEISSGNFKYKEIILKILFILSKKAEKRGFKIA